mgnify:CR=1 FL=1
MLKFQIEEYNNHKQPQTTAIPAYSQLYLFIHWRLTCMLSAVPVPSRRVPLPQQVGRRGRLPRPSEKEFYVKHKYKYLKLQLR